MRVSFIGLGNMCAPMAANLAHAGHEVLGFDVVGADISGVVMNLSAKEVAKGADIVFTMLPNGKILRYVASKIIPEMRGGTRPAGLYHS